MFGLEVGCWIDCFRTPKGRVHNTQSALKVTGLVLFLALLVVTSTPTLCVPDLSDSSVKLYIKPLAESNRDTAVTIPDSKMRSCKGESIILVPVLQRQISQGGGGWHLQTPG